jgi:myosin-1
MFHRRHHCRVTGELVCAEASMHTQLLPDKQLHTPQRISDPMIGLISTDPLEDTILLTGRKTEVSLLHLLCWARIICL